MTQVALPPVKSGQRKEGRSYFMAPRLEMKEHMIDQHHGLSWPAGIVIEAVLGSAELGLVPTSETVQRSVLIPTETKEGQ